MKTIINFFRMLFELFFGKSVAAKSDTELKYDAEFGVKKTPKRHYAGTPAGRRAYTATHNNRKDTEARHVQYIHMKTGETRAIFHQSFTS